MLGYRAGASGAVLPKLIRQSKYVGLNISDSILKGGLWPRVVGGW